MLSKALEQSQGKSYNLNRESLVQMLSEQIRTSNIEQIRNDVAPFLENPDELQYLEKSVLLQLVEQLSR